MQEAVRLAGTDLTAASDGGELGRVDRANRGEVAGLRADEVAQELEIGREGAVRGADSDVALDDRVDCPIDRDEGEDALEHSAEDEDRQLGPAARGGGRRQM